MKQLSNVLVLLVCTLFILSCGGSGSGNLSTDQVNAVSAALTGAMGQSEAYTTSLIGVNNVQIDSTKITCTTTSCTGTVNETYNCPSGGHITSTGNMALYCTNIVDLGNGVQGCASANDFRASMSIVFHVSDPTNNLNDCNIGNNVVLDGTVNLTVSGMITALTANINGTIDIDTIKDGGLTPIASSCYIFISYPAGGTPNGTICGNTVS